MDPSRGQGYEARPPQIPGYEFQSRIGTGGMGEIYRAKELATGRIVAIKVLNPTEMSQTPLLAFQRETEAMTALDHPNVVKIFGHGYHQGMPYLVMEFVPGTSLRALMHPNHPWPLPQVLGVLDAVTEALRYIHGRGILHLDLKPENILCGPEGMFKIADFGLAQTTLQARILSSQGNPLGSMDYCAPEQRHGLEVDVRTDLFALATITYELLTGEVPGRVYVPVSQRNPLVPRRLDEVLRRGLARDPAERFTSVGEFQAAVRRAVRRRWLRWLVLAAALLTLAVLGWRVLAGRP
ncbi:MAG: serine/threonine protein kinase [Gemmataceae bacterium]|nr:serine/threonine protein kinase [Gemmataceae bacterium]MDW8264169.1 serine/threonine-protein kinase [Gemmataceae bacterium]